ncbi:hypothetical protein Hte_005274 [Hypoxylon texense]
MRLFDFPPEVVDLIFEAFAHSREFNRFMRLRLVSRQFKYFADGAVFRLRLLDVPKLNLIWMTASCQFDHSRTYVLDYLAYQVRVEKDPKSLRGRIRRAAVTISEQMGDTEQISMEARLKSLCRLAICNTPNCRSINALFYSVRPQPRSDWSDEQLERDLCVAAVYLGYRPYIEKLISQGCQFCNWGNIKDVSSRVFGGAYGAAILEGDVSTLRLLISSNPYSKRHTLDRDLQLYTIRRAAIWGRESIFNFALDCRPIDLTLAKRENFWMYAEFQCVIHAMASTRVPEIYDRLASILICKVDVHTAVGREYLIAQLTDKARKGHVEMVRRFLGRAAEPFLEAEPDFLRGTSNTFQPLVAAAKSGDADVVKLLLDHGDDPNRAPGSAMGHTALMCAVHHKRLPIAKTLLEAGADVNDGCPPPVVFAILMEDTPMFRLLRRYGAKLDTPETGVWAMVVARLYGLDSMVDLLVQEGVDTDAGVEEHGCPGFGDFHRFRLPLTKCRLHYAEI